MLFKICLIAFLVGYVALRASFSVRSVRARRQGDVAGAERVSRQGRQLFLAMSLAITLAFVVYVAALVL